MTTQATSSWSTTTADGFAQGPTVLVTDDQGENYTAHAVWTDDAGISIALVIPEEPIPPQAAARLGAALIALSKLEPPTTEPETQP